MFDKRHLKHHICITETAVECPVLGCQVTVDRQKKKLRREDRFRCPIHKIVITPSTFEYPSLWDNVLWHDDKDQSLLRSIASFKRESRISRERSEDALTWNVFRYLERSGQISEYASHLIGVPVQNSRVIYWSYSQDDAQTWPNLTKARLEFGEHNVRRSSEPDLLIVARDVVIWIEAKFTDNNNKRPSSPGETRKYCVGGDNWYDKVFNSDYESVANASKKYELMRLWLLGTWVADLSKSQFYLVSLVCSNKDKLIEQEFRPHIRTDSQKEFMRTTWEDIYDFVSNSGFDDTEKKKLMAYMENKTAGYKESRSRKSGELQLPFDLSP